MTYLQRYYYKVPELERKPSAVAFFAALDSVASVAPSAAVTIYQELRDQWSHLKLIASENYSSLAVQQAMGNLLTDKYAEGYPFHRFYAGCENVDVIEQEAVDELKILFEAETAYVQPHSGADANMIAFWSILCHKIQDPEVERLGKKNVDELTEDEYEKIRQLMLNQKVMGLSLDSGGHLTHGFRRNASGKMFRSYSYGVDPKTGLIDYQKLLDKAEEVRPTILLAGYSAYPRKINFAYMREIAERVGAVLMTDMAHFAGLVAGKVFEYEYNPIPYSQIVTSTTHKTLRGPRGGIILCKGEWKETINRGCPLVQGGPMPHVMAAKLTAFKEANSDQFKLYAQKVVDNARHLAEELMKLKVDVLTGGTENHLVLFDVRPFGLTGKQAESVLSDAKLTVNRNCIPEDPNGAWFTSGIRIGTPAVTTRGLGPDEMKRIAGWIVELLKASKPATVEKTGQPSKAKAICDPKVLDKVKGELQDLLKGFALYPELDIEGANA